MINKFLDTEIFLAMARPVVAVLGTLVLFAILPYWLISDKLAEKKNKTLT